MDNTLLPNSEWIRADGFLDAVLRLHWEYRYSALFRADLAHRVETGTTSLPTMEMSLQDRYAPKNRCFGCGPANDRGLRIKSYAQGDEVFAEFRPEPHHQAFEGMLNGGIIGALLDCHSNWTAAYALMKARGESSPPCTVTAEFHVKLLAVTPLDTPLSLRARPTEVRSSSAVIEAEISVDGKVTATCRGVFVAVKEGHPAYHRW